MKRYQFIQAGIMIAILTIDYDDIYCEVYLPEQGVFSKKSLITDAQKKLIGNQSIERYEEIIERIEWAESIHFKKDEITFKEYIYRRIDGQNYVQHEVKMPLDIYLENNVFKGLVISNSQVITYLIQDDAHHPILAKWQQISYKKPFLVNCSEMVDIKTRDHQTLSSILLRPKTDELISTILIRTPYGKEAIQHLYTTFVMHGYAVLIQDVRGRNNSSGDPYMPKIYDRQDGDDTLNWIANQSWSNKRVGMIGASYLGYVQWAAASSGNPYLKAIVSVVTAGSAFVDLPRKGGAFISGGFALGFGLAFKQFDASQLIRNDWDQLLSIRPIEKIAEKGLGFSIPYVNEQLSHPDNDEFWRKTDFTLYKDLIKAPAMIVSGWFDDNQAGTREALSMVEDYKPNQYRVILGPWMHKGNTTREINHIPMGAHAIRHDLDLQYHLWLKQHLENQYFDFDDHACVEYYMIGKNQWLKDSQWPLSKIEKQTYYLNNQELSFTKGYDQRSYTYDPNQPTPHLIDISENELSLPNDYQEIVKRNDVLLYQTDKLNASIDIAGQFEVNLTISSTAVDSDFVVRVLEINDEGEHIQLADGFLTARYRHSFEEPIYLVEGEKAQLMIKTSMIAKTIEQGHRLGLMITSSAKHYTFPHSNTKGAFNTNEYVIATHTIYHDDSYLVVPIKK